MSSRRGMNHEKPADNQEVEKTGTFGLKTVMTEIKNFHEDLASIEDRLKKMEKLLEDHASLHVQLNQKLNDIIDS